MTSLLSSLGNCLKFGITVRIAEASEEALRTYLFGVTCFAQAAFILRFV
jgi:hypothetical protein